ncbi:MAG: hypothetical protein J0L58_03825 [Burkholderiales bacterium]|nr:hypothetical protein [Burkholderiales bacterium]
MVMRQLVPKVFYDTLEEGFDLWVGGLGCEIEYQEAALAVVAREGIRAYVVASPEYAAKDRPEIAIETDDIEALHAEISARRPDLLHPNLPRVTRRPWGALEFALLDRTTVCIVFRQWPDED